MSQKEFMDKYGDDVLSGYILPTPDELEQAEQEEGEEEEVQGDLESLADEEESKYGYILYICWFVHLNFLCMK